MVLEWILALGMQNMVSGGLLCRGGCAENATCLRKSYLLRAEFASSPKKHWSRCGDVAKTVALGWRRGFWSLLRCTWVCYVYLFCTSNTVAAYLQYVCPCLCVCVRVSTRCLGARGAGGALQGGLGEASGEGSDAGICQRRGREQLVPATDCGREVQVLQEDLGHSHEALVVHTPVIPPHDNLRRR